MHLRIIKYVYIFKLKTTTLSHKIYGELGIFPITTEIQTRIISFWSKLIENSAQYKLSPTVYYTVYNMHENRHLKSQWLDNVKNLLCSHGYSGLSHDVAVIQWITSCHKNRMTTRYITFWRVHITS